MKLYNRVLRLFLVTSILLLCSIPSVLAQQVSATISGIVTDASGSVIPNAHVVVTNRATNVSLSSDSNATGEYRINLVPVGTYTLKVSAPGFKTFVQTGIVLDLGQSANVNAQLAVGGTDQTVTVTTGIPLVNTTTSEVGITVQNREIENLPISRLRVQMGSLIRRAPRP